MEEARQKKAAPEAARASSGAGGRLQNATDGAVDMVLVCLGRGADVSAASKVAVDVGGGSAHPLAAHSSNTAEAGSKADARDNLGVAEHAAVRGGDNSSRGASCALDDRELAGSQPNVK